MRSNASFHDAASGLILLPAGLERFANELGAADVDSSLERTKTALRGLLGVVDSLKQTDQSASGFPSDAITEWKKRELAISEFDTALRRGDLRASAYNPASGQRTEVDPLDFYTASELDPTIRSGVVQGLPGEAIARLNGSWLLVRERDVKRRLAQFRNTSQLPKIQYAACRDWLTALMTANPERSPVPRNALMREAKDRFGCSERQFKLLLKKVAQDTGIKWPLGRPPQNSPAPAALRG
jgi:hypothetical protein